MARLSPAIFAQQAEEFLEAARREFSQAEAQASIPGYFLVSRSLELTLKSFMLLKGHKEVQLRRFGHDLRAGLAEARSLGLDEVTRLTPEWETAIQMISAYYDAKDLEYLTTGYKCYPQPSYLLDCTAQVLRALRPELRRWSPQD